MRNRTFSVILCVVGFLGLSADAKEKPTDEYVSAMKALQVAAEGLPPAVEAGDHETMLDLVVLARPALIVNEEYWVARQVDHAIDVAKAASKAISEVSVAVHLMSLSTNPIAMEGAAIGIENFVATCDACHSVHREELSPGDYRIK